MKTFHKFKTSDGRWHNGIVWPFKGFPICIPFNNTSEFLRYLSAYYKFQTKTRKLLALVCKLNKITSEILEDDNKELAALRGAFMPEDEGRRQRPVPTEAEL